MMMKDNSYQGGNKTADTFDRLYNRYYPVVFRFVYRFVGDYSEAEDITQETFIRLDNYLNINSRDQTVPDYVSAWLYRVAANLCCNLVKRKKKYRNILTEIGKNHRGAHEDVETNYIREEKQRHIRTTLAQLPARDQILLLLYQDGISYAEMAEVIKVKKTSIGKLLSRAIERCARKIREGEDI